MLSVPSQSTSPRPSGRKGSKKVRTGCITCKIRKVKCDESKPHCLRCVKTGRKCDGYRQTPGSSPEPMALSPSPSFESPAAARAFDHYRMRTAKVLSPAADAGFWGGLVLKLSATEPAVRHAILAISSLHECAEAKSRTGRYPDTRFAFREYGNAATSLRNWAQRDETSAIPLLVCVLFICIEFLADRQSAAQLHIMQGRKILSGLGHGHSPAMELVKRSLVPFYTRLSLASFLFGSRPAPVPGHLRVWTEVPPVLATVDEARSGLYSIVDEALQFSTKARVPGYATDPDPEEMRQLQHEQQRLLSQLSRWFAAFTVLTSMSPQSPALGNSLNMLRLYHQTTNIWVSTALQPHEFAYDIHMPAFAAIVSLASSIIGSVPSNAKMEPFTFETEVVGPVYWAAVKCRHPLLRRAALKLLTRDQVRDRRENLWHARQTAVVAARVIEMEECDIENPLDLALTSMTTHGPGSTSQSSSQSSRSSGQSSRWSLFRGSPNGIKIDISRPPTLPAPEPSFTDPSLEELMPPNAPGSGASSMSSPGDVPEPMSPISSALEGIQQLDLKTASLDSPYGVPANRRVKNTLIGPAEEGGIWTTFFRDPHPGQTQWRVTREFLRC
ncbi:hypothetical protein FZEAL_925 [Fusarium zealandicum]|uniref:Zn(2)-C6 fungal-type domain-containing protein n=1 Tax=Fusarium zealandicum TaxID=1053134 RepID=A0A8H4UUD7_9HYPO|nr:hypothetical protein FZEAL_925 [Fusarium zealandicum]